MMQYLSIFNNPYIAILAVGIIFILVFGLLSILRREGLSTQFAIEAMAFTSIVVVTAFLTNITVHPVLFFAFLYLITMRSRLLVDMANFLSSRGRQRDAINILQWALKLRPDRSTKMVIQVNMGIVQLRRKNPTSAEAIFKDVLSEMEEGGGLGIKYEAACRYNLAQALLQTGKEAEAVREFNETIVIYPNSIYSSAADRVLKERRSIKRDVSGGDHNKLNSTGN